MSKVFVIVEEFWGTVTDVSVYRNEPKNFKAMKEGEEEGERCYVLEIQESEDDS